MSSKKLTDVKDKIAAESQLNPDWLLPASRQNGVDELRVICVGQGDAVAFCDNGNKIFMYVDYGGCAYHPDKGNSYKNTSSRLSISDDPVIVLTHWDKDHYYSGTKVSGVESCKWLVPRQRVGPQAAKFSAKLTNAYLWPESIGTSTTTFSLGGGCTVEIQKCGAFPPTLTAAEDRNLTGLAVTVIRDDHHVRKAIVLAGDAPFDKVPMLANWPGNVNVVGLLAYHHGSHDHWTTATTTTLSKITSGSSGAALVYSYGVDNRRMNQYGHPDKSNYSNPSCWTSCCETPSTLSKPVGSQFCRLSLR